MVNQLNRDIVLAFSNSFQTKCLTLIADAYDYLTKKQAITIDFDEEQITANIFQYIDNDSKAIGWNINVSDEVRLYCSDILNGRKKAKSAQRIDLRFSTNWLEQSKRVSFFVEAKNLYENDCSKSTVKTPIKASSYQERYITTGIDNILNGNYPSPGCIVGYVLDGCSDNIAVKINNILKVASRQNEVLSSVNCEVERLKKSYNSIHPNSLSLNHIWLEFNNAVS